MASEPAQEMMIKPLETLWPQDCGREILEVYRRIFEIGLTTPSEIADVSVILSPGRSGLSVTAHLGGWDETKQESDFYAYSINTLDQTGLAEARYLEEQLASFLRTAGALAAAASKGEQL